MGGQGLGYYRDVPPANWVESEEDAARAVVEAKAKELHVQTTRFAKQTAQWLQLVERFNSSYDELGDVEQWTKGVESDLSTISTSLEYVASVTKRG